MESLPRHVRHAIYQDVALAHAAGDDRAHLARLCTISREWQEALEIYTFAELLLTPERLPAFARIVAAPRRRTCVRSVVLHIALDSYGRGLHETRESREERQRSSEVFTGALTSFLFAMTLWAPRDRCPHGLDLHLVVCSPSDMPFKTKQRSARAGIMTHRAQTSPLRLDPTCSLPVVDVFSRFRCSGRQIMPTSMLEIAAAMPSLLSLDVRMNHDSRDARDVSERKKFAAGLAYSARSLKALELHRSAGSPKSTHSADRKTDAAFCNALRNSTQYLESFSFDDCVDALQFFTPFIDGSYTPELQNHRPPLWENLKKLTIRNSYLVRRPYMRAPNRVAALASVHKLLTAVGRAVAYMPNLHRARVCQYVLTEDQLEWFVLTYHVSRRNTAVLEISGIVPTGVSVDAWRTSVLATRGLQVDLRIYPGEQTVL